jgi:DNA primase
MPWLDLRQARAEVRLAEVLELLGWRARALQGLQVRGPCPVHGSQAATSRVFSAHLGRNVWHCFGCGASGNALDLWAQVRQQTIYEAVRDLYDHLGRRLPLPPPVRNESEPLR